MIIQGKLMEGAERGRRIRKFFLVCRATDDLDCYQAVRCRHLALEKVVNAFRHVLWRGTPEQPDPDRLVNKIDMFTHLPRIRRKSSGVRSISYVPIISRSCLILRERMNSRRASSMTPVFVPTPDTSSASLINLSSISSVKRPLLPCELFSDSATTGVRAKKSLIVFSCVRDGAVGPELVWPRSNSEMRPPVLPMTFPNSFWVSPRLSLSRLSHCPSPSVHSGSPLVASS